MGAPLPTMLRLGTLFSLTVTVLSFHAPSTLQRGAARMRPIFANENKMEPEGGWGVDSRMDTAESADGSDEKGTADKVVVGRCSRVTII